MGLEIYPFSQINQQEILTIFNERYTEEALVKYLMNRINSQPDGSPGLAGLRNHVLQKLAEQATEEELKASKEEVQKTLGVSETLADDPSFYVKLHYHLYPKADMHDECHTDLNEKGIKAFAKTLEDNPFDYFNA